MKAMVFAAGLGTRLRPYTNDRPKALVEVAGKSLLAHVLLKLRGADVQEVIVNVHHFADQVEEHLHKHDDFGLSIRISDERELLLDTGGGLLKARKWLDGAPFLVHNVDIITSLDVKALYQKHLENRALATLATRERNSGRYLLFNGSGILSGWENAGTGEQKISRLEADLLRLAYSGVCVIDPGLFGYFPETVYPFSLVDVWLEAAKTGDIRAFSHNQDVWLDVGKPETLAQAALYLNTVG